MISQSDVMMFDIMKQEATEKITITLPHALYHQLRNEARRQNISLPDVIQKKIQLKPSEPLPLARLPLKEIIAQTKPSALSSDVRLDFYS